jgi:hypothetical protein
MPMEYVLGAANEDYRHLKSECITELNVAPSSPKGHSAPILAKADEQFRAS